MVFHIKLPGVINGQKWGKLSQIGFQVENMCNYMDNMDTPNILPTFGLIHMFYFRLIVSGQHCVRGMRTVQARPGCACEY